MQGCCSFKAGMTVPLRSYDNRADLSGVNRRRVYNTDYGIAKSSSQHTRTDVLGNNGIAMAHMPCDSFPSVLVPHPISLPYREPYFVAPRITGSMLSQSARLDSQYPAPSPNGRSGDIFSTDAPKPKSCFMLSPPTPTLETGHLEADTKRVVFSTTTVRLPLTSFPNGDAVRRDDLLLASRNFGAVPQVYVRGPSSNHAVYHSSFGSRLPVAMVGSYFQASSCLRHNWVSNSSRYALQRMTR